MKTLYASAAKALFVGLLTGGGGAFTEGQHWLAFLIILVGVIGLDFWADYRARHGIH